MDYAASFLCGMFLSGTCLLPPAGKILLKCVPPIIA
jgi:hypothetical protein